jgi:hypothetical protein
MNNVTRREAITTFAAGAAVAAAALTVAKTGAAEPMNRFAWASGVKVMGLTYEGDWLLVTLANGGQERKVRCVIKETPNFETLYAQLLSAYLMEWTVGARGHDNGLEMLAIVR